MPHNTAACLPNIGVLIKPQPAWGLALAMIDCDFIQYYSAGKSGTSLMT